MTAKVWTPDEIRHKLATDDAWTIHAILAIYERQTNDEKIEHQTNYNNKVGFNGLDADILSSFAERIMGGLALTQRQHEIARRRIMKYAGQLAKIANGQI